MTTVKLCFFPSIYQLGSNFVKQLYRIQIQKGGKILLWNQVLEWKLAILNLFYQRYGEPAKQIYLCRMIRIVTFPSLRGSTIL